LANNGKLLGLQGLLIDWDAKPTEPPTAALQSCLEYVIVAKKIDKVGS
jgi:hypothetical protein